MQLTSLVLLALAIAKTSAESAFKEGVYIRDEKECITAIYGGEGCQSACEKSVVVKTLEGTTSFNSAFFGEV
jgi:hypothetical protein